MFTLPVKDIIVNDDSQVQLLKDDLTAFGALSNITPSAGGFIAKGFLTNVILGSAVQLLSAAKRIIKDTPSAGVAAVKSYVLTTTTTPANAVFRIVSESLDLTPTEYQNLNTEKRYQISAAQTTTDGLGAKIAAVINADAKAIVTATYTAGTDTLQLTAKTVGVDFNLYSTDFVVPAATGVTNAALPVNTYDYLKNINWAKNFHIDRDLNWMPLPGVTYNSYYFEVNAAPAANIGNDPYPSEVHGNIRYGVKIWVKVGLTLDTALNELAIDLNV